MTGLASGMPQGWRPASFNQGWTYHDQIGPREAGQWLTALMSCRYRHSSAAQWQHRLEQGELLRNGIRLVGDVRVEPGDRISWKRPPWREPAVPDQWQVIRDDGDVLVLNKPSGLPVMPGGGFLDHTLTALLLQRSQEQGELEAPRPVHRLGRFTSGLQVCARQPQTRARLSRAFRPEGGCHKLYQAWSLRVEGLGLGESQVIANHVVERTHPLLGWVWGPEPVRQEPLRRRLTARSEITVVERHPHGDLLHVAITTGRPHQIRIHLAQLGSPLLGDPLYLPDQSLDPQATPGDGGYCLHAWRLQGVPGVDASAGGELEARAPDGFGSFRPCGTRSGERSKTGPDSGCDAPT